MTEYTIDKDIPLPPRRGSFVGKYDAITKLEPTESFFIPINGEDGDKFRNKIATGASNYGKKHDRMFVTKRRTEKKNGKDVDGVRVWRVE